MGCRARFFGLPSTALLGGTVTFQVGDKVIYPNHGLGIVERIEDKTILGTTCGFYHLRILANETTVLVPVANVDGVGLRRAISDKEVERLFTLLGDGKIDNHQNWRAGSRTTPTRCAAARFTTSPTCSRASRSSAARRACPSARSGCSIVPSS